MNAAGDALRIDLQAARDDLLAVIDGLAPGDLERPTHNGYADVRATLAHLASAERGRVLLTRACLLIHPLTVPHFVINFANALNVGARKRRSIDEIERELQAGRRRVLRWLDSLSDGDLERPLNDPIHGRRALKDVIRLGFAGHERAHTDEIQRALN